MKTDRSDDFFAMLRPNIYVLWTWTMDDLQLWHALFAYVAEVVTYVTNSQQFCEQFEITEQFMGYLVISN